MKEQRWISPYHARVRSAQIGDNIVLGKLTDKQIEKYQERGWYDVEAKMARKERAEKRAQKREKREGNWVVSDGGGMIYSPR
jgi:hypothetical protein